MQSDIGDGSAIADIGSAFFAFTFVKDGGTTVPFVGRYVGFLALCHGPLSAIDITVIAALQGSEN